jgi:hypothetical protein
MSKTTLYDVHADGKAYVIISGRFQGANGAMGTLPITSPPGWSVAYVTEGKYTLTFDDQYAAFISCTVSLEADTPADVAGFTVLTSTYTAAASPTLTIYSYNAAGTPALADVLGNCYVNFTAVFRNTTVTP